MNMRERHERHLAKVAQRENEVDRAVRATLAAAVLKTSSKNVAKTVWEMVVRDNYIAAWNMGKFRRYWREQHAR